MSSTNVGSIHYDLSLDTQKFDRAMGQVSSRLKQTGDRMVGIGKTMTAAVTVPVVAGFGFAVKAASDLQETINKVDVSFKDQANQVKAWARTSITSMGLAQQSALDAAALFGDMSTSMGLNTKEAAKMSTGLVQVGADLASFKNVSFERAQTALTGIYTGETEALKGLGIVMTETNLAAFAQSRGITKNIQDMTQAEKVQLRYAYVMNVTKNAQGDFNRTASSTANMIRQTRERFKELSAQLGQQLLPIANLVLGAISGWLDRFSKLPVSTQRVIMIIAGLLAVVGPLLFIIGQLITTFGVLAGIVSGPVLAVLVILGGIIALLIKRYGGLSQTVQAARNTLERLWAVVGPILLPALRDLWAAISQRLIPSLKYLYGQVKPVLIPALKILGIILGVVLVAAMQMAIRVVRLVIGIMTNLIRNISAAINIVKLLVRAFISMAQGVAAAVGKMLGWVKTIPTRIKSALGNLGGLLFNAGRSIFTGLLDGMKSAWEGAKNWVGSIAGKIKSLKGPIQKDRKLLIAEGAAIMQGLNRGLLQGFIPVKQTLRDITGQLGANPTAATMSAYGGGSVSTSIYGNVNIGSQVDAQAFMRQLSRNQELAFRSVATRPGSLG